MERSLFEADASDDITALVEQLAAAQSQVAAGEAQLAAEKKREDNRTRTIDNSNVTRTRGLESTGLQVTVQVQMASVPTSIYHLLDAAEHPLADVMFDQIGARDQGALRQVACAPEGAGPTLVVVGQLVLRVRDG